MKNTTKKPVAKLATPVTKTTAKKAKWERAKEEQKERTALLNAYWDSLSGEQKADLEGVYRNALTSHAYSGINLKLMAYSGCKPGPMIPVSALYRGTGKNATRHYRMNKGTSVWVARWIIKEDKEGNPIKGDEGQPIGYWKWMGKVVPLAEIRTLDGKPVDITMIDYEKKTLVDAAPELIELARQEYAMKKLLEGDEGECL